MSLSEKLIIAAKNGSTREVRKLLGRGALFTKDQVNSVIVDGAVNLAGIALVKRSIVLLLTACTRCMLCKGARPHVAVSSVTRFTTRASS